MSKWIIVGFLILSSLLLKPAIPSSGLNFSIAMDSIDCG